MYPNSITVSISVLGEIVNRITGFVTQLKHNISVLTDNSSLIAVLVVVFILHLTLAMHTRHVTCLNHLLEFGLVRHPMRIEHARNTRHRQNISIRLQQTILQARSHRVILASELTIVARERVMVIHERHGIFRLAGTRKTCSMALGIIKGTNTVVQRIVLGAEIKHHRVPTGIAQTILQHITVTVPILHYREIRSGSRVIVINMIVREALTVVITPTVKALSLHPFQISAAHSLHIGVLVIPVTSRTIILLAIITCVCMRTARTTTFIISCDPCIVRLEGSVRSKIQGIEITGIISVTAVVNDNVRYSTAVTSMQRADQQTQISLATKCAVQITVLLGNISSSVTIIGGREPNQVKVLAQLCRVIEQGLPTRVTIGTSASSRITVPVECL